MPVPSTSRKADAAFGIFFLALVPIILVVAWDDTPVGALVVAAVVGLLGVEALVSAVRNRRSLVSRIGPIP